MGLKLRCEEYGFECTFGIDDEETLDSIKILRDHFDNVHGIDYTIETVLQMIGNRGYSLKSIKQQQQ